MEGRSMPERIVRGAGCRVALAAGAQDSARRPAQAGHSRAARGPNPGYARLNRACGRCPCLQGGAAFPRGPGLSGIREDQRFGLDGACLETIPAESGAAFVGERLPRRWRVPGASFKRFGTAPASREGGFPAPRRADSGPGERRARRCPASLRRHRKLQPGALRRSGGPFSFDISQRPRHPGAATEPSRKVIEVCAGK